MARSSKAARKLVLPSGLTLVHEHIPSSPAVAFHLWIKVGSACEPASLSGISHFLEHMLFKGTEERDAVEINDAIENLGGNLNAFTSYEQTAYHLVLSQRFWREGLNVLWDMVFHPLLDEEEMEIERQVISEELREGDDSPETLMAERFFGALYPNHGYGRPVIGTADTIRAIDPSSLQDFYAKRYRPCDMVLAVSGNVEWPILMDAIRELDGDLSPEKGDANPQVESALWPENFTYVSLSRGQEERIVELALPIPGVHHPDTAPLDLLSFILGEGPMSRLFREVRLKKQLARAVGASLFSPNQEGRFIVRALPYEAHVNDTLQALVHQIIRLRDEGISPLELHRAKLMLEKELLFNDETADGRAKTLAFYQTVFGSLEEELKYREQIALMTVDRVHDVARRYFDPQKIAVGLLLPASEKAPEASQVQELIRGAIVGPNTKNSGQRSTQDIQRWTLGNGLRVVCRSVPHMEISSVYAAAVGGQWAESSAISGVSSLVSATLTRGTVSRTDEQIAEEEIVYQGELTGISGKNSQGLQMDVVGANTIRALDLFSDVLIDPQFAIEAVDQERNALLRELAAQEDYFEIIAFNLMTKAAFPMHPYGLNPAGAADSVKALTPEQIGSHYRSIIQPQRLVIGIVGDLHVDRLREEVEEVLGDVRAEELPIVLSRSLPDLTQFHEVRRPIHGEKAYVSLGFRSTCLSGADRYAVEVLASVLSSAGGGRLFVRLREELGLVYSIDTSLFHGVDGGLLSIAWNTNPEQAERSIEEVRNEVKRVTREGISEEEVARVRNFLIGSYEIDLQRSGAQAAQLCIGELFGTDKTLEDYGRGISNVTKDILNDVASKYLTLDRAALVILSPGVH